MEEDQVVEIIQTKIYSIRNQKATPNTRRLDDIPNDRQAYHDLYRSQLLEREEKQSPIKHNSFSNNELMAI